MTSQPQKTAERDETPWEGCPPGVLVTMSDRLAAKTRRRQTLRGVALASVLLLAGGGLLASSLAGGPNSEPNYGGIVCSECGPHLESYQAHLTGRELPAENQLSDELTEQIRQHLAGCKRCRAKFSTMYPGLLSEQTRAASYRFAIAYQPNYSTELNARLY